MGAVRWCNVDEMQIGSSRRHFDTAAPVSTNLGAGSDLPDMFYVRCWRVENIAMTD